MPCSCGKNNVEGAGWEVSIFKCISDHVDAIAELRGLPAEELGHCWPQLHCCDATASLKKWDGCLSGARAHLDDVNILRVLVDICEEIVKQFRRIAWPHRVV